MTHKKILAMFHCDSLSLLFLMSEIVYGDTPAMYYVVISSIALGGTSLVLVITKLIRDGIDKSRAKKLEASSIN